MSTGDPEEIRADIERTREELSHDVDALGDKVNPSHFARRQAERLRAGAAHLKERVRGDRDEAADTGVADADAADI